MLWRLKHRPWGQVLPEPTSQIPVATRTLKHPVPNFLGEKNTVHFLVRPKEGKLSGSLLSAFTLQSA